MHGLINRSIQCFVQDTYGNEIWSDIAAAAGIGFEDFEALMIYDDGLTDMVLVAASERLAKSRSLILEDIGTYLVSHENVTAPRRLLRFGGATFIEFLHSLDELQDRTRLAVPELEMPALRLRDDVPGRYTVLCNEIHAGMGHVIVGALRAMADDYGALVVLEHMGTKLNTASISVQVLQSRFSSGRTFDLAI